MHIPLRPHKVQIALVGQGINAADLNQALTVSPGVAYKVAALGGDCIEFVSGSL